MKWIPAQPTMGVNLFSAPEALQEGECRRAKNLLPLKPGMLSKRPGIARPINFAASYIPSAAAISPVPGSNFDIVIAARHPTDGFPIALGGLPFNGSGTIDNPPFDHPRVFLLPWGNGVYALPGPNAIWLASSSGGTGPTRYPFYLFNTATEIVTPPFVGVPFQGTGNENVFPAVAAPYKQRLVLANFGRGYGSTIVFTDDGTVDVVGDDVLAANSRAISLVAGQDGDEIVAMVEVMLTNVGSPAESGLLILRRYGTPFLLTGDMDQTGGGTSTLDIKRISIQTGCAGPYTVARTPVGIIWAGADDVWAFAAGVLPTRIGQKIQPALKVSPASQQYRWSGVYHDGFYRLAVWGAGQSMARDKAPGDQWWLDLRDGLPGDWTKARWWGPQQFLGGASAGVAPTPQTFVIVPDIRGTQPQRLIHVDYSDVLGTKSITLCEYADRPRDTSSPVSSITDYDYVDPEVTVELVSREFALSPPYLQLHDGIMMILRPDSDVAISADHVVDDGLKTYTTDKRVSSQGFRMGSSPLDSADDTLHNKPTRVAFYPAHRWGGSQARFELRDSAGYVIDSWNRYLVVDYGTSLPSAPWLATIATGAYTRDDLLTALQTAINATRPAGSPAWTVAVSGAGLAVFSLNAPGAQKISINFTASGNITAAQAAASLRLASLVAVDTSDATREESSAGPGAISITGRSALFKKAAAGFELYGLQAQFEVYPREP